MSLTSFLKGSEKKIKADPLAGDINNAGKTGLGYMNSGASKLYETYNQDPTNLVNSQIDKENFLMKKASQDAVNRTKEVLARRGMTNSSIGIGTQANLNRDLNEKVALNNASGLARIRDMSIQNGQGIMNAGNALWNVKASQGPVQMTDVKYRSGGLAPLVGAGVGAYFGGAAGAQAGSGLGQMYANS